MSLFDFARPYQQRYGLLGGVVAGLHMRQDWARPAGTLYPVRLPDVRHPFRLRAATSDAMVVHQVFLQRQYDFPLPFVPRTILDAGANVGLASIRFVHRFPSAAVLAVEFDPDSFALLADNVAPYPQIRPLHAAVWMTSGVVTVANPAAPSWSHHPAPVATGRDGIPARTMPELLEALGGAVDLLKLDIEGTERELLGPDAVAWLPAVRSVAIEVHEKERPGTRAIVAATLQAAGLRHAGQSGELLLYLRTDGA